MALNLDFAPTFLDTRGAPVPKEMQGVSLKPLLEGKTPKSWRQEMYYRYWMHLGGGHNVTANYGIRTHRYKLIYYYGKALGAPGAVDQDTPPEWEFYRPPERPARDAERLQRPGVSENHRGSEGPAGEVAGLLQRHSGVMACYPKR